MKKLLIILFAFVTIPVFSQDKGKMVMDISASVSTSVTINSLVDSGLFYSKSQPGVTNYSVGASAGWYITENMVIGGLLSYHSSFEGISTETKEGIITCGPFMSYYFTIVKEHLYFTPNVNSSAVFAFASYNDGILGKWSFLTRLVPVSFEARFNKNLAIGIDLFSFYYSFNSIQNRESHERVDSHGLFMGFNGLDVALRFRF